jgi:DNA-binding NarL/FixJ family response regulator
MATTVLIVDDHPGFRASARMLLEAEGFDVVGEAGDGRSGLDAAAELKPDVVLLDIQLPDMDGFAVAMGIDRNGTAPAVVLISSRAREDLKERVESSPVRGFIPKSELSGAALEALIG